MLLDKVVKKLTVDAGLRARIEYPDCVVLALVDPTREWWFGTANATWMGDLMTTDDEVIETIDTGIAAECLDAGTIAHGIAAALLARKLAQERTLGVARLSLAGGLCPACGSTLNDRTQHDGRPSYCDTCDREVLTGPQLRLVPARSEPLTQLTAGSLLDLLRRSRAAIQDARRGVDDETLTLGSEFAAVIALLEQEIGASHMGTGADVVLIGTSDSDTPPDTVWCDECENYIPDTEEAVNPFHKESCSLHPSAAQAAPTPQDHYDDEEAAREDYGREDR